MNITIVGAGYVGYTIGILLSKYHNVIMVDNNLDKVNLINEGKSPINDSSIESYQKSNKVRLSANNNLSTACHNADLVIIALPTDNISGTNHLDTTPITDTIRRIISINKQLMVVIKSTVPIGYTEDLKKKLNNNNIIFSPEFLREGSSIFDCLNPSRIIMGEKSKRAEYLVVDVFLSYITKHDVPVQFTTSSEAEAIKLFSNSYLAMRVAYVNEIDTYARIKGLNTATIITGMGLDERIGNHYNNPSFGYGGYCLPKDTKQLLNNFNDIPNTLIGAIVESNEVRLDFIISEIKKRNTYAIGIYRLTNTGSANYKKSIMSDILCRLQSKGYKIIIYEPTCDKDYLDGSAVINDLDRFKTSCSIILADRITSELKDIKDKLFTCDTHLDHL